MTLNFLKGKNDTDYMIKKKNNENNEDKPNLCLSDSVPASSALER
jgi:hypothetical protein